MFSLIRCGSPRSWALRLGKASFDADAVPALIYPNPLNPQRYVVINSGHTWGMKEIEASNAQLFPRLPDFAIIDPAKSQPARAEFLTEDWQFKTLSPF